MLARQFVVVQTRSSTSKTGLDTLLTMGKFMVASSRAPGVSGTQVNDHAFFAELDGSSHVFYRTISQGDLHPHHRYGGNGSPTSYARQSEFRPAEPSVLQPGEFYPRVWRGYEHPPSREVGLLEAEVSTRRSVQALLSRLRLLFDYVEPSRSCAATFGHELRSILILACTEVESSWKAILKQHGVSQARSTVDYYRLKEPLHLDAWELRLQDHPQWGKLVPFGAWSDTGGKTSASLQWYHAYNMTKHDRESHLAEATLENVINAVAAAQVMMLAQFGWPVSVEQIFDIPLSKPSETFELVNAPSWTAAEEYVAPLKGFDDQVIGLADWTPATLIL